MKNKVKSPYILGEHNKVYRKLEKKLVKVKDVKVYPFMALALEDSKGKVHRFYILAVKNFNVDGLKSLSIGYTICHPEDEYDADIAFDMAYRRAISSEPLLYAKYSSLISENVIENTFKSYVNHIVKHKDEYLIDKAKNPF